MRLFPPPVGFGFHCLFPSSESSSAKFSSGFACSGFGGFVSLSAYGVQTSWIRSDYGSMLPFTLENAIFNTIWFRFKLKISLSNLWLNKEKFFSNVLLKKSSLSVKEADEEWILVLRFNHDKNILLWKMATSPNSQCSGGWVVSIKTQFHCKFSYPSQNIRFFII